MGQSLTPSTPRQATIHCYCSIKKPIQFNSVPLLIDGMRVLMQYNKEAPLWTQIVWTTCRHGRVRCSNVVLVLLGWVRSLFFLRTKAVIVGKRLRGSIVLDSHLSPRQATKGVTVTVSVRCSLLITPLLLPALCCLCTTTATARRHEAGWGV